MTAHLRSFILGILLGAAFLIGSYAGERQASEPTKVDGVELWIDGAKVGQCSLEVTPPTVDDLYCKLDVNLDGNLR